MKTYPIFSIIIPTYNRSNVIENTIQSVINQTFQNFELIIVDDGSTDNTEEVVKPFLSEKIRYFKIQNSERGFARNFGAKQAIGEWLNFFDSDDILYNNHLETAFNIINNYNIKIFHLSYDIKTNKTIIHSRTKILSDSIIYGNPFSCNSVFIEKNFFQNFYFNENRIIAGLEDWELWLRISAHTEIKHFPIITSAIIQHPNRSVMQVDKDKWIKKIETFIDIVTSNPAIIQKYHKKLNLLYCGAYTYLALHLSFDKKNKKETFEYLLKGLKYCPFFIFKKRFWAVLKRLIF
ncbi:MAG TPA: glycosyltransferase [Bacteroidia bacterium]|nr:glycosyltransferase [Bacteroidia bacterium]